MADKLSKQAYGGVEGSKYVPYVGTKSGLKDFTPLVVVIGIGLAIPTRPVSGTWQSLSVVSGQAEQVCVQPRCQS